MTKKETKTPEKVTWKSLARPSAIRERVLAGETVEITRYNLVEAVISLPNPKSKRSEG